MQEFVRRQNIRHLTELLRDETDEARRHVIEGLLAEVQAAAPRPAGRPTDPGAAGQSSKPR